MSKKPDLGNDFDSTGFQTAAETAARFTLYYLLMSVAYAVLIYGGIIRLIGEGIAYAGGYLHDLALDLRRWDGSFNFKAPPKFP